VGATSIGEHRRWRCERFATPSRAVILETVGWVIGGTNGAAAGLGLHRTTLINRMRKLGITRPARPRPVDGGAVPAEPPDLQH
jgi:transcriptional regulator of acetoin/glycerol metabolism